MTGDLNVLVAELQQLSPRLQSYAPMEPTWQQAEVKAMALRNEVAELLRTAEGVQKLRESDVVQHMKALVPACARDDIAELPVPEFVLGLLFVEPYVAFEIAYRGYGTEYAKELSSEARKSSNIIKSSYIYGEILFFPFASVIRSIAPTLPEHAIFYDLGSGIGKAVLAASLVHPFDQAIGIEFLEPLVACADKRKASLLRYKRDLATDIEFIHGSMLTVPWTDGDVIFCHGTCFNDKEWHDISLAAEKLKQGAYFISTSHVLNTALFEVIQSVKFPMSWGSATLYIHRRRKIGRWAAQMLRGGKASRTDLLEQQVKQEAAAKE